MQFTALGRTGLKVSVAGLGAGGFSDLGLSTGKSSSEAVALVRLALELGVNVIDTAASYGTEEVIGEAIQGFPREAVVISTKGYVHSGDALLPPEAVIASLEASLRRLRTDHVDMFHLHGVPAAAYDHALRHVYPVLAREKERGRVRHIGITASHADFGHDMLLRAVESEAWEAVMVAFHMMHQGARQVFSRTRRRGIGTMLMYVVRTAFSRPERLREILAELKAAGELPAEVADDPDAFGFLVHEAGAADLTEAAYRFARHEPGADVVLFGTGNPAHLRANIRSILKPPLPEADRDRLAALFGHLVGVGLDRPGRRVGKMGAG